MDYDTLLHIETNGTNHQFPTIRHYHRYEPTSYDDLLTLSSQLQPFIRKNDRLVDFGSGLMRVPIFMNYRFDINTAGIELNKALYMDGMKNIRSYEMHHQAAGRVHAFNQNVTDYRFTGRETILFFFNPFSADIFKSVLHQFLTHAAYNTRVLVILYYAKGDYIDVINQLNLFTEISRIPLSGYPDDENDLMIIYQFGS
ncbi:hypothetical protein ERX35_003940 [Macrococcus equipercicus]|uniref:Class I SAM-dependent methyltransferase n=1 Tax=Macrococcus equipercicus TaxID=69967 RepID=A0ABQ6RA42_9STAP|nr:hypothetical protein [Macrococcus equipercicus]KAA1040150.1 hypothetical protein ERX35_003940 [Macrococcus equipercicus]